MIPVVGVLAAALFVVVVITSFGVSTSCTNAWSCSSTDCSECRVVSIAAVGGLALGGLVSVVAIFSRWPRRGRGTIYVIAMVVTAVLTVVLARSWKAPGA